MTGSLGPLIKIGDSLELHAPGAQVVIAAVQSVIDGIAVVEPERRVASAEQLSVRFGDHEGVAWETEAKFDQVEGEANLFAVAPVSDWTEAPITRLSRRVPCRVPLHAEGLAGTIAPGRRFDFTCLDVSASGLRASFVGNPPEVGDRMRVNCGGSQELPLWVDAVVARIETFPFRRFEIGFRFDPASEQESRRIIIWRDAIVEEQRQLETERLARERAEAEAAPGS